MYLLYKIFFTSLLVCGLFLISSCREQITFEEPKEVTSANYSNINLEITSPSKWELWRQNGKYNITWETSSNNINVQLKIELTKKGKVKYTISDITENDGFFEWDIPNNIDNSNMYQIKITNLSNENYYSLSEQFSIRNF